MRNGNNDDEKSDEDDDDEAESPELQAAMAVKAMLEAEMVDQIFKLEAVLLREEIRVETTWPVRDDPEEDNNKPVEEYGEQEEEEYEDEEEFEDDEDEEEEYSEEEEEYEGEEDEDDEEEEYEEEEDEDDEDLELWAEEEKAESGKGKRKRTRAHCDEEEEDMEEQAMAPSPPAKRAKFEYPCVVPTCDRGYQNKASLQRHVYKDHVGVSDPVARRACRLLWGETFKGGRQGEVNRRYGEYPKGV
jgi:hypothetical protein